MVKLNMAKINTLFKKGYLLAGVMMAANVLVVNEVRASNKEDGNEIEIIDEVDQDSSINTGEKASPLKKGLKFVLTFENYFNFFGTLALSVANNYFKWWDYNPGGYLNLRIGCLGWRSKSFLNGTSQFEITLNLGKGAFWMIATFFGSYRYLKGQISITDLKCTAAVITASAITEEWKNGPRGKILFFFLSSLQGFVSMPLAIHISNFSISISLDSIIWELAKLSTIVRVNMGKEHVKKDEMNDENKIRKSKSSSHNEENANENNNEENNNYN